MDGLIIACVRTGTKYPMDYVVKLRNMVQRHIATEYMMVCLTDQPERCDHVHFVDISVLGLDGWWGKMALFEPQWRGSSKVVALDLDTVVCGDLWPLCRAPCEIGMLRTPVKAYNPKYPCNYNSSVIVLRPFLSDFLWRAFERDRPLIMADCGHYGDQLAIERLYPDAEVLQKLLPKGYFLNYRDLSDEQPGEAAVVNFGGKHKPDNCEVPWIRQHWQ